MEEFRICENCGHANDAGFTQCEKCTADILHIAPTKAPNTDEQHCNGKEQEDEAKDQGRKTNTLGKIKLVSATDGYEIEIPPIGCMIGREGDVEAHYFSRSDFVSRKHARIFLINCTYFIVDDNSHNGSMLNKRTMQKGKEYEVTVGDSIIFGDLEFQVQAL
jgi:hypothetical protein